MAKTLIAARGKESKVVSPRAKLTETEIAILAEMLAESGYRDVALRFERTAR